MALMICPECGKKVSERAEICPNCGFPVSDYLKEQAKNEKKLKRAAKRAFTEEELKNAIATKNEEAKTYIDDEEKFEKFIQKLEKKLKNIPGIGPYLSDLTCAISLVRSYIKREYREIPLGSVIGIVSALIYVVSPIDLIPDPIPGIGFVDDAAAITFALKMFFTDIEDYKKWRRENGKEMP